MVVSVIACYRLLFLLFMARMSSVIACSFDRWSFVFDIQSIVIVWYLMGPSELYRLRVYSNPGFFVDTSELHSWTLAIAMVLG